MQSFKGLGSSIGATAAVSFFSLSAIAEPCSTPSTDGGLMSITISENFTPSEWEPGNGWRAIADEVQKQYGNRLAHDTPSGDIHITFNVRVAGIPAPMPPLLVPFSGNKSIEKEILDNRGFDVSKPDPNPCESVKQVNQPTVSGGGSSGYRPPSSSNPTQNQNTAPNIQTTTSTSTYVATCEGPGCGATYTNVTTTNYYVNGSYAGSSRQSGPSYTGGGGGYGGAQS